MSKFESNFNSNVNNRLGNLILVLLENLSKQEIKRLEQLRNWELECRDYNEVLKELANQQIEFDLDDGVDTNYAKFEGAVAKI